MRRSASLFGLMLPVLIGALSGPARAAGMQHPSIGTSGACVSPLCHARLLEAASGARDGSVHQPASGGDCVSCHDLALASEVRFVRGAPTGSADGQERARAWDLALCLGCHGEEFLAPNAPATGFADGKRNLHTLHVQAGRGRRCLPCHDPHAARQPKLLRERIPARGNARIAQEFRGAPQGGWCKTGCHAPKAYKR
jgi:predicted CXXCH cytochrome family protein